ncbi:MAG TPA: SDR family NAD(P)-dependent oxidoreductase [Gammaproteobacteria bacterium]|nr:SDR family NAD(P)-dependent oxidoreductase [Gammaproteobacteria bacterium]
MSPPAISNGPLRAPLTNVGGKTAFITGGSSGIGLGIARACAAAGMRIVITFQTEEHVVEARRSLEADGATFRAIELDVRDRHAMANAEAEARSVFGNIHLLCNNAGVGIATPITESCFGEWDFALAVNLGGVINGVQTIVPGMMAHGEPAHVVATASMSGLFHGGTAGIYTTTKFAVVGMMEALRAELAPAGIGVSVLCPGFVTSNIHRSERKRPPESFPLGRPSDRDLERAARLQAMMPVGMPPLECGERVLRGIRRNDMYILTHPEYEQGVRDRFEALLASMPPPERLEAQQAVLRHAVYVLERQRLAEASA